MKLSVLIITYNQERFIAKALDSVLMQETNFDFQIVIGDDCSTDGTRDILLAYQKRVPDRIKLLMGDQNSGGTKNFVTTYKACCGEYVAILEGDDYWVHPNKLQDQVVYLDKHPEFVMCFTNGSIVDENGKLVREDRLGEDRRKNLTQLDIVSGLVPPTNTVVFRNNKILKVPKIYFKIINGDIIFFGMLAEHGDAAYVDTHTACYRMHGEGIWSGKPEEYLKMNLLKTRMVMLRIFFAKYWDVLLPQARWSYKELMRYYKGKHDFSKLFRTFFSFYFVAFILYLRYLQNKMLGFTL